MRVFCSIFLFFICIGLIGQAQSGRLTVYGKVKYRKGILNDVAIEIYRNNELLNEITNYRNGNFKLELPIGFVYSIAYRKENFIEKSVAIIAKADSTESISGRYFFQLDIELFKEGDEDEDESILPPVAKLYIKTQKSGFQYDKKYVRWVAEEYDEELTE